MVNIFIIIGLLTLAIFAVNYYLINFGEPESPYSHKKSKSNETISSHYIGSSFDKYHNNTTTTNPTEKSSVKYIQNFAIEKKATTYNGFDILFIIDATSSMSPYIFSVKETVKAIIEDSKNEIKRLNASEESIRFAIVAYRDHPPEDNTWVTKVSDFKNSKETIDFLNELTARGGGDMPEAVLDGINAALNEVQWRPESEKSIIMALDAPPHGERFDQGNYNKKECPCGLHESTLLPKMREMKIDFSIIKLTNDINKMIDVFSQYINIEIFNSKVFEERSYHSSAEYNAYASKEIYSNYGNKYRKRLEEL